MKLKQAYSLDGHEEITRKALENLQKRGIEFSEKQVTRLIDANKRVDTENLKGLMISKKHSPFHYHVGEEGASNKLIKRYLNKALEAGNTTEAMDALGIALHTAQDRYSHFENKVPPGIAGLLTHLPFRNEPDSIEAHPGRGKKALKKTEELLRAYVRGGGKLGRVGDKEPYYKAVLSPEEQEELTKTAQIEGFCTELLEIAKRLSS